MSGSSAQELQDEFLNVIRASQEAVVEAVKTWVDTVRAVTPKVPFAQVPLVAKLPKPENVVTSAYDFAEKLLSNQRQFAVELAKATAPLMAGNGTREGEDTASE